MEDDTGSPGFEALYAEHYPAVVRYACARFGAEEADDIAQETMERALRSFADLNLRCSALPWLLTVARRVGIDRARRRRFTVPVGDEVLLDLAGGQEADRTADVAVRVDVGDVLRGALGRLTDRDREVLALHEIHGFAIGDIAVRTRTSANTVRQRLFRARRNLGRHYHDLGGREYAFPPPAVARALRARVADPVRRATGRVAARVSATAPGGRTAILATATIATAATMLVAPPRAVPATAAAPSRPGQSQPAGIVPVPPIDAATGTPRPVLGLRPGLPSLSPDGAPALDEGWERGLGGWSISGARAGRDCRHSYRGRCSLALDPAYAVAATATVIAPFDVRLMTTAMVRLPSVDGVEVALDVVTDTDTATLTVVRDGTYRFTLSSAASRLSTSVAADLPATWHLVAVTVDPVARSIWAQVYRGGHLWVQVMLPLRTAPHLVERIALRARRQPGAAAGSAYVDDLAVGAHSQCWDGVDNDGDGRIDGADPGCAAGLGDFTESPDPACGNGVDDDGDGLVDLADPGCREARGTTESPQCSDGVDNNGDGTADYPDDPKCLRASDPSEVPECSDGVDNESDGRTDYPADLGCASPADDTEWTCVRVRLDARDYVAHDPEKAQDGVCFDPFERVGPPVAVVAVAPAHRVLGYVDEYAFALPNGPTVPLLCVELVDGSAAANTCAAAGGRFTKRVRLLVDADHVPGPSLPSGPAAVCAGEIRLVIGQTDASPLGRDHSVLMLC